jgi:indole-3-glycerol phosphate synthase
VTILDEIFAHKRVEVEQRKRSYPLVEVRTQAEQVSPPLDFVAALRGRPGGRPALIAEIKCASPSRGLLALEFDPLRLARLYQSNGASAISVLTDERYFKGSLDHLRQVAALEPRLPLLRKDFIMEPYQIYEARAAGADAVLLIVAGLDPGQLRDLHALAFELGMAALVEVHTRREMESILDLPGLALAGINNRDLRDFSVTLDTTLGLRPLLADGVCVIAESGIHSPEDVDRLMPAQVDAILVGEALVTADDPGSLVRSLSR